MSPRRAMAFGSAFVNGPVLVLLAASYVGRGYFQKTLGLSSNLLLLAGFALAWLWWSIAIPQWRLWAYQRVESVAELKRKAIAAGLVWRTGSFFEKTEIKSKHHAAREAELERERA